MNKKDDFQESDLTPEWAEFFEDMALLLGTLGVMVVLLISEETFARYLNKFLAYLLTL